MGTLKRKLDSLIPETALLGSETFSSARAVLEFTLNDGAVCGFPLSWLYRYDYLPGEDVETLLLQLAEHRVTIRGQPLGQLRTCLHSGEGFHVHVTPERYLAMKRLEKAFIESITIEPLNRSQPEQSN